MFENLSEKLEGAFRLLKGENRLTEINIAQSIKEIRRALVAADVNYKIAKDFTDKVKDKALGTGNVLRSVSPGQLLVKIVEDELTALMGGQHEGIHLSGNPSVILIAGLQGSGKTTFSGKLAHFLKTKKRKQPLLVACDVYRPAAIQQLIVLGEQTGVPVFAEPDVTDPVRIALRAIEHARKERLDTVIVDTAGRLAVDGEMMLEIAAIRKAIIPQETLFVVDAMTGQDAVSTAEAFHKTLQYDGVVLTKLDGDTRGGAALSIKYQVGKPIKFASNGEKIEALDPFYPDRMARRILGMGDIVSLVEKAQEQFDEKEVKRIEAKIRKNQFDFNDFMGQIQQIKKMGDMKSIMGMIPGMGKMLKNVDVNDQAFLKVEAAIQSMTPIERTNPELLNGSRKLRIARGSGQDIAQINALVKQFEQMRRMMQQFSKNPSAGIPSLGVPGRTKR